MHINEQIKLISERILYLRDTLEMTSKEVASKSGLTEEQYLKYENAESDIPISAIYSIASALGVDATELITGEAPHMEEYTVTRKDKGVNVERFEGYSFESLAHNFIGRDKEPMIVTIAPSDEHPALVTHDGQEFNYVLSGSIGVTIGNKTIILNSGDSIYFKPSIPHGQFAVGGVARFLTIIDKE